MRTRIHTRLPLVLGLVTAASLAIGVTTAAPATVTINLCATDGTVTLPGGVAVDVWGFVDKGTAASCDDLRGTATLPSPVLDIGANDDVTLNVTNALPPTPPTVPGGDPGPRTLSFEIPGLNLDPGPTDAEIGDTVTRTFHASAPGTYLSQAVGDGERQTAMGLYGALIVRSGTANQAYGDPATAYNVEKPLVLSAIDTAFNDGPDGADMREYRPTYWLINGRAFDPTVDPATDPNIIHAGVGQKVLLRYVNAGHDNTTMTLLGMDERVLARDAHLLPNAFDAHAETIPAGQTEDVIATVPALPSGLTNGFPLYNRQLHLGNGEPGTGPGGMMTFIRTP